LRQTRIENKSRDIVDSKIKERERHCLEVYEAIISLQNKAKTKEIKEWLDSINKLKNETLETEALRMYISPRYLWTKKDKEEYVKKNWHHTPSARTIERCIDSDPRIIRNGWYYSVDEEARFETRYLDPKGFGMKIYKEVIGNTAFRYSDKSMSDMIRRFGTIMMFIFIEASRPFQDKRMSSHDKDELVGYWAKNAVPLNEMFSAFKIIFNWRSLERKHDHTTLYKSNDSPANEMTQKQVEECLRMLESACPDIYKEIAGLKKKESKQSD
jgi:hypothetical protein